MAMQNDTQSNKNVTPKSADGFAVGQSSTDLVGFWGATPAVRAAALTTQLTTITPADAAGTPDYAIAAITSSSPFGFSNAAEGITLLYVIKNLQTRMSELESRLQTLGILA